MKFSSQLCRSIFASLFLGLLVAAGPAKSANPGAIISFKSPLPPVEKHDPHVKYDLDPTQEKFFVWTPAAVPKDQLCGLIVFIYSDDRFEQLPPGWEKVLTQHKLMFVAPQGAGNTQLTDRRLGLAATAARAMMAEHAIDPQRVYAAGLSGGARMAGRLGFYEPDLFHGTIQSCGADFYEKVPRVTPRTPGDKDDDPTYGEIDATADEINAAKEKVRFVLITGSKDFRHANILDLFHGGYEKAGFNAKLIDTPGMEHAICNASILTTALAYIEDKNAVSPIAPAVAETTETAPQTAPAWGASDPTQWPIVYLYNNGLLTGNNGIGGSGFLFTLPNRAIVAATVLHVFGENFKVEDIDKSVKSWSMESPANRQKKVTIKKLAMTIDPSARIDCVIVNVSPTHPWPAEVLTPRPTPIEVGETVYVPGMQNNIEKKPSLHKATITKVDAATLGFVYVFDPEIDTIGFSGAPVLDSKGFLVGIHQGHGDQDGKKFWTGLQIQGAINVANAPAGPALTVAAKPVVAASPDESATKAQSALDMAQNYIAAGKYDLARSKLENIISTYPTAPATTKAKSLLATIAAK